MTVSIGLRPMLPHVSATRLRAFGIVMHQPCARISLQRLEAMRPEPPFPFVEPAPIHAAAPARIGHVAKLPRAAPQSWSPHHAAGFS